MTLEELRKADAELEKTRLGRFRKWYRDARGRGGLPIQPKVIRQAQEGSPWIVRATMHMFKVSGTTGLDHGKHQTLTLVMVVFASRV